MTNTEIVVKAFDHLGGSVNHNKALISAISQMFTVSEAAATQLVELAIADRVLVMDSIGEIRKGPAA
jgi:hypothetical protein